MHASPAIIVACLLLTACSSDDDDGAPSLLSQASAEGVFAEPCSVLEGSPIGEGRSKVVHMTADMSSCEYTSGGQTVQVMVLSPLYGVEELLARSDCEPLQIPGSESVCAYARPLPNDQGSSGSSLVVKASEGTSLLTTAGEPIPEAELREAATKLVEVWDS